MSNEGLSAADASFATGESLVSALDAKLLTPQVQIGATIETMASCAMGGEVTAVAEVVEAGLESIEPKTRTDVIFSCTMSPTCAGCRLI